MASTFPTSRSDQSLRNGLREIQSKRANLTALEEALKKRINELKELCLKEGEITGQIPIDYPLHPREPLPQIRRRVSPTSSISSSIINHNNNINTNYNHLHLKQMSNPSSRSSPTNSVSSNNMVTDRHIQQFYNNQPSNKNQTNYLPYHEETKPFQMSDFYKYSSKHRESSKSTRQLQEEVSKKASLKYSPSDDKILASVKFIEERGQRVMEATAKAIAGNPELAEKLKHTIMPGVKTASSDSDMRQTNKISGHY